MTDTTTDINLNEYLYSPVPRAWDMKLIGPAKALDRYGHWITVQVEGIMQDRFDENNLWHAAMEAVCEQVGIHYDDQTDEDLCPWDFSYTPTVNEYRNTDGSQTYFVTVYEVHDAYGGPEEGGWSYTCGERVRQYHCGSFDEALKLRETLRDEFPVRGHDRYDAEYSIGISLRPREERYPDTRPHYE